MVELADTPDLGSGARACRFKSCHPHFKRILRFLRKLRNPLFLRFDNSLTTKKLKDIIKTYNDVEG